MTDRIVGCILLAIAIAYGITAGDYEARFGDPLGPAALPMMLAVPAALLSLALILKPDPDPAWVTGRPMLRQLAALVLLLGYAQFLETLGFLLATFIAVTLLGKLLRSTWLLSAASGAVMSVVLFVLFDQLLGLPLPLLPEFMG
ncbi:tripartite tricarboxylate transporter TctB family protein [Pararhizobium haloflavum]|uniref:tripartite tricarboxylate transporter TctB family protein n=1 Tax=Pararhizobium haloflavum TaxID=2037914 RepID=UPI000C1821A2|nr:tripartite tricarboxylate transporter TctB family protein [Pararhizobium haloflavum]